MNIHDGLNDHFQGFNMYPSLIKRPIRKPPPFHITRLSRASVHRKTESTVKADEDCEPATYIGFIRC